jgi:hypothetical protein
VVIVQEWASWAMQLVATTVTSAAVVALVLRLFPDMFAAWFLKRVEHRNQIVLETLKAKLAQEHTLEAERLKGEISGNYAAIKSSVDFISANQRELRVKMIEATEALWKTQTNLKKALSDLSFVENCLLPREIKEMFVNDKWGAHFDHIKAYAREDTVLKKWNACGAEDAELLRVFVSEKLWLLFFVSRALFGRIGYLYAVSFKEREYRDWRKDEATISLLRNVIDQNLIDNALKSDIHALHMITNYLDAAFLKEALSIMSGLRPLADTIGEFGTTMLTQKESMMQAAK